MRLIPLGWMTVHANSETAVFVPATAWFSTMDIKDVQVVWEMLNVMNSLNVQPAYQVADFEDAPGNLYGIPGAYQSTADVFYPGGWKSTTQDADSKQLIRFGWLVKNNTGQGTGLNLACVGGVVRVIPRA